MQLAEKVIDVTGLRATIVRKRCRGTTRQRQPDISLRRTELAWEPRTNLDEGLKRTIVTFSRSLCETTDPQ